MRARLIPELCAACPSDNRSQLIQRRSENHALDCALWLASSLPRKGKPDPFRVPLPDEAPIRLMARANGRRIAAPIPLMSSRLERPLLAEEVAGRMRLEAPQLLVHGGEHRAPQRNSGRTFLEHPRLDLRHDLAAAPWGVDPPG